jgi:trimethylamine:corrinoid methyltransferase-like protein
MISGAGMLDFLACQSLEKLVIDAEAIANARRFLKGIGSHTETLALEHYQNFEFPGNFLAQDLTRQLYKEVQYMPSDVIDRGSLRAWKQKGSGDIFSRAKSRVQEILAGYQPSDISSEIEKELEKIVSRQARVAGMDTLPRIKVQ